MFAEYTKGICSLLVEKEHIIISKEDTIKEETSNLVLIKPNSPVLYGVNVINCDKVEGFNFIVKNIGLLIEKNLENTYCSSGVVLNLLVTSNGEKYKNFVDSFEFLPGDKVNNVYWVVDLLKNNVYCGKNQPTEILDYKKVLNSAFKGNNVEFENIKDLEKHYLKKSRIPVKSKDYKITISLILINILIYVGLHNDDIFYMLANDSSKVIGEFQLYRLLTCMFLHGSLSHVMYNSMSLYIFGSRIEMYLGKKRFLGLYFGSGIVASLFSALFTQGISVGASGGIFGLIGAMVAFVKKKERTVAGLDYFTMVLFAMLGMGMGFFHMGTDNFAHIGGFLCGFILQTKLSTK